MKRDYYIEIIFWICSILNFINLGIVYYNLLAILPIKLPFIFYIYGIIISILLIISFILLIKTDITKKGEK